MALETSMDNRKAQFTLSQFSSTNDRKIKDGRAKVPTKVFKPFVSELDIIFNRPAKYLKGYKKTFRSLQRIINNL